MPTTAALLQARRKKGKQAEGGRSTEILEGKEICTTGFSLAANVSETRRVVVVMVIMRKNDHGSRVMMVMALTFPLRAPDTPF